MHIAAVIEVKGRLIPALNLLHKALSAKAKGDVVANLIRFVDVSDFSSIVKIGRTHLMVILRYFLF